MIGKERIKAVRQLDHNINIICVVDPDITSELGICHVKSIEHCILSSKVDKADWIFISTPHDETAHIAREVLDLGHNILVEKPFGRTLLEADSIMHCWNKTSKINVGFNYRFFEGVNRLLVDVQNKKFGDLISVNMNLGLSNVPGTENTWRLDPKRAGRGSIIYAGIHLIDLAMIMSGGTLKLKDSLQWSGFYKTGVEEEMHILASDCNNTIYNIQSSITHWKSVFRIEVNGTEGYGIVEGRNRNYKPQTYRTGKRWGWMQSAGKNQRETEEWIVQGYSGDDSFIEETRAVLSGGDLRGIKPATWEDNRRCFEFIDQIPNK